jgi:hypothetical protein
LLYVVEPFKEVSCKTVLALFRQSWPSDSHTQFLGWEPRLSEKPRGGGVVRLGCGAPVVVKSFRGVIAYYGSVSHCGLGPSIDIKFL